MTDKILEYSQAAVAAIISAVVGAGIWLVRTILTDSKRLSLLEQRQDIQHREIKAAIEESRKDVRALEAATGAVTQTQAQIALILDRMEKRGSSE